MTAADVITRLQTMPPDTDLEGWTVADIMRPVPVTVPVWVRWECGDPEEAGPYSHTFQADLAGGWLTDAAGRLPPKVGRIIIERLNAGEGAGEFEVRTCSRWYWGQFRTPV